MQDTVERIAATPEGEARLRLAAIVDSADDAIIGKDLAGIVTSWNRAAEAMFGYAPGDIIGRPIRLIIPADRIGEERVILDKIRRGETIRHFETERQHRDGRRLSVSLTISPIRDDAGRIVGISKIARDLTARRARERRLAEVQAELVHVSRLSELGHMVSALAHEISQPLTAMANYRSATRQLLAAGDIEKARTMIERISEQAERARLIIGRLRALVRKDETHRDIESLGTCIEEARALALIGLSEGLKVDIHVADDAAEAMIDRIQIQQVLLNLMRNAVEAMAGSPRRALCVTTARVGEMVEIRVADTGPGLPELVRERLFRPFVTTKPDGLGVGLSVCQSIVEAHGGEISAMDAPGGGTIFRLTLPRGPDPRNNPEETTPNRSVSTG